MNSQNKPVEMWFFRHGETLFNVKNLIQGWCDSPLTEDGILKTKNLGMKLKNNNVQFRAVYSSDLTRCLETADILLSGLGQTLEIHPDKRLRELNTGECEGDCISEHLKKYPLSMNIKKYGGVPQGEKWDEVFDRIFPALDEIGEEYKDVGGKIMVVSHSMVISAIISYINGVEELIPTPHNSVTIFEYHNRNLRLKQRLDSNLQVIEQRIEKYI